MDAAWQTVATIAVPARPSVWDPRLLWLTVALAAVILIGTLVIVWIDRWRKRSDPERLSANDQLANFRELYDQGELSQEEFERIRARLSAELRQEMDVRAAPPGTTPQDKPGSPPPAGPGSPPG